MALLRGKICFLLHENMSLGKKNLGFCADLKIGNEPYRQHGPRKSINYKKPRKWESSKSLLLRLIFVILTFVGGGGGYFATFLKSA
jgi:hypothetical protein